MVKKTQKKKSTKKAPKARRKPSVYSVGLAEKVLDRVRLGHSQRFIAEDKTMPSVKTMTNWKKQHPEFAMLWSQAWEDAADIMAEDCLEIADNTEDDIVIIQTDNGPKIKTNKEVIARSKLRCDLRLRLMESRKPKVYGKRQEINLNTTEGMTEEDVDKELTSLLETANKMAPKKV